VLGIKSNPGEIAEKEDGRNVVAAVPGGSQTVFRKLLITGKAMCIEKLSRYKLKLVKKLESAKRSHVTAALSPAYDITAQSMAFSNLAMSIC
jgi:hypothetical protein